MSLANPTILSSQALSGSGTTPAGDSLTSSSFTPTGGVDAALFVSWSAQWDGSKTAPTISDTLGGYTWINLATLSDNGFYKFAVWYALVPSSPTAGTVTISGNGGVASNSGTRRSVLFVEQVTGVDQFTPIVQSANAGKFPVSGAMSLALGSTPSATSMVYGWVGNETGTTTPTVTSPYVAEETLSNLSNTGVLQSVYQNGSSSGTISWTNAGTTRNNVCVAEIKASTGLPPVPALATVSPLVGALAGGTAVTITGTGFISGATVAFGGLAATGVTIVSTTSITCTSPAGSIPGTVDVTVTTTAGTSPSSTTDQFTYTVAAGSVGTPAPPLSVVATTPYQGQASLIVTPSTNVGTSPLLSYTVTSTPGNLITTGKADGTPILMLGLTNGTSYSFTAHATNQVGNSLESGASNSITPVAASVPAAPTNVLVDLASFFQYNLPITSNTATVITLATAAPTTLTPGQQLNVTGGAGIAFPFVQSVSGTAVTLIAPVTVNGYDTLTWAIQSTSPLLHQPARSFTDGVTDGSATLTSAIGAAFVAGDVGRGISGGQIPGGTTIVGYNSATSVVLSSSAPAGSNPSITIATAGVSFGTGSSIIADLAVTSAMSGWYASGTGIPIPAFVGTVTANTSFVLVGRNGNPILPTASGTSIFVAPTQDPMISKSGAIRVYWTPTPIASNGGAEVTQYVIKVYQGGTPVNLAQTAPAQALTTIGGTACIMVWGQMITAPIWGLTDGTAYTFTVMAQNEIGVSAESTSSTAIAPANAQALTVPGAPTIGTATAGVGQLSITFAAPVSNGGKIIRTYTATASPANVSATGTSSPIVVTGLPSGTAQTVKVTAHNQYGDSAASSSSNSVTPT